MFSSLPTSKIVTISLRQLNDWQTFIETVRAEHYPTGSAQYKPSSWLLGKLKLWRTNSEESLATLNALLSIENRKIVRNCGWRSVNLMVTTFQESAAYLRNGNWYNPRSRSHPADECQRDIQQLTLALNKVNDRLKHLRAISSPLELINDHLTPTTDRDAKRTDL